MGSGLSTGAIVGIVVGVVGFVILAVGCSFLRTVLNHRRRVRRAVNAAAANVSASSANGPRPLRSRYPEAIPCENYDELFPNEEPVRGNVVFQSRADIDRMRDVLVRIEDAGADQSSEDFSTTEMVSVNNSFAPQRPHVQAGHIMHETLKPTPAMVPSRMGSFDNEHNVAMSFVSVAPTPASSMPALATRSRGQTLHASSFNPGVGGSYAGSYAAPPPARADGTVSHYQDRNHGGGGGLRLLVPAQERGRFSEGRSPRPRTGTAQSPHNDDDDSNHHHHQQHLSNTSGLRPYSTTPVTDDSFASPSVLGAESYQPVRQRREGGSMSMQDRVNANAASFSHHLAPSFSGADEGAVERRRGSGLNMRPPTMPQSMGVLGSAANAAAARSGLLGTTRQDPTHLHRAPLPAAKKHKVRIRRQHRVRNVDKGGYVVLEETESSSSDKEGEEGGETGEQRQVTGAAEEGGETSPSGQQAAGADRGASQQSPSPAPEAAAAAKKSEKKRRYYFEKLSSLDVYGRGQYLAGATGGFPPMEEASSGHDSDAEVGMRTTARQGLSTTMQQVQAPVYMSNSSRKPT